MNPCQADVDGLSVEESGNWSDQRQKLFVLSCYLSPFVLEKLKLRVLMFLVVLYPPQLAHFNPMKWNFTVDCWRKNKKYHMQLKRTRLDYSNKTNGRWFVRWFRCQFDKWQSISCQPKSNQIFNSLWSNHCRRCPQYCSRAILERVNFVLVYRGNPTVWSYRSLMFDKLDTRNDLMPAEL